MRVAILSLFDFDEVKGGTELFARNLKKAFPDSECISYSVNAEKHPRIDLSKINLEVERKGISIGRHFARLNKENPYDLVICNDIAGFGLKLFTPQVPAIQVFHYTYKGFAEGAMRGLPGYYPSRFVHPSFEKLAANGKKVVAVSHKTRRELEKYYGLTARVIENAVSLNLFRPLPRQDCRERLGIKWDGPIGIFVGRADSTKGFDVIRALTRKRKDLRILCVTGSHVIDKDMIIARRVPNEEMPYYYSAADFLLFPSRYESASYTTIEALACNLPVVAYRTGFFEDLEGVDVGEILNSVDVEGFSRGIDHVLGKTNFNTRSIAEQRFSMDRFIEDYRLLGRETIGGAT